MSGTEGADIITNDDAVVDCIVDACESRNHGIAEDQRARLTRRVAAAGPDNVSGKECSITMCGNDDDPSNQLLQYCENGHCLHDVCIEYIFDKAESLSTAVCPQCRSQRMIYLVTRAKPIESDEFALRICHKGFAEKIISVAAREAAAAAAAATVATENNSSSAARVEATR